MKRIAKISVSTVTAICSISLLIYTGCNRSSMKSLLPGSTATVKLPAPSTRIVWHENYEVALAESKRTGKPILADFTGSDWCHWCVKLKTDIFETSVFQDWADQHVVLLELDFPKRSSQSADIKKQNQALADRYEIRSYPTVLFLNSDGEPIGRMGYLKEPTAWIAQAEILLDADSAE